MIQRIGFGMSLKKAQKTISQNKAKLYNCEKCLNTSLRRVQAGIWFCKLCKVYFAGGAYSP